MYNMVNTDIICPNCAVTYMVCIEPKVIKSNTKTYEYLCPCCGFEHMAKSDEDMQEYANSYIEQEETMVKLQNSMIRETDIKCPVCGAFIFCDESMILTSNPPQHRYYCPECGEFSHTAFSDGYLLDYIKKNFATSEDSTEKKEVDYHAKQDYGKAKLTLVPRRILWDIAAIREYGNNKYPEGGPDNWKAVEVDRYRDATYRHFLKYLDDPHGVDKESGLPHLWHLATNIAFLCELEDEMINKGEM